MILRSRNFTVDLDIVNGCLEEIDESTRIDRYELFDNLVSERLTNYNKTYVDKLNVQLDELVKSLSDDKVPAERVGRTINKINRALSSMYNSELALLRLI